MHKSLLPLVFILLTSAYFRNLVMLSGTFELLLQQERGCT